MTTLPAAGYISNAARTQGEDKQWREDIRNVIAELPGGSAETTLTIASGSITPTVGIHAVDTEAAAATDDLTNIAQTNHPDGRLLILRNVSTARTVVVKHSAGGAGQVSLKSGADLLLDGPKTFLLLKRTGALWEEVVSHSQYRTSQVLDQSTADVTIGNTATETTAYTFTVPARLLALRRGLRLTLLASYTNNAGGGRDLTVRFKLGGSTLISPVIAGILNDTSPRNVRIEAVITNRNVANLQNAWMNVVLTNAAGTIATDATTNPAHVLGIAAGAIDTTAAQALTVTVQHSAAHSTTVFVAKAGVLLELL